jgi:hypothetical protein
MIPGAYMHYWFTKFLSFYEVQFFSLLLLLLLFVLQYYYYYYYYHRRRVIIIIVVVVDTVHHWAVLNKVIKLRLHTRGKISRQNKRRSVYYC